MADTLRKSDFRTRTVYAPKITINNETAASTKTGAFRANQSVSYKGCWRAHATWDSTSLGGEVGDGVGIGVGASTGEDVGGGASPGTADGAGVRGSAKWKRNAALM